MDAQTTATPGGYDGHNGEQVRARIVDAIAAYQSGHQRPPTVREIMDLAAITSSGHAWHHIRVLIKRGHLVNRGGPRGLFLTSRPGDEP